MYISPYYISCTYCNIMCDVSSIGKPTDGNRFPHNIQQNILYTYTLYLLQLWYLYTHCCSTHGYHHSTSYSSYIEDYISPSASKFINRGVESIFFCVQKFWNPITNPYNIGAQQEDTASVGKVGQNGDHKVSEAIIHSKIIFLILNLNSVIFRIWSLIC